MDLDMSDGAVVVTLSERNLGDLTVAFAEHPDDAVLVRMTDDGYLVVRAQSNERHYGERTPGPGYYGGDAHAIGLVERHAGANADPGSEED